MEGRTPLSLQYELKQELEIVLREMYLEDYKGERVLIHIYLQELPPEVDDDPERPFPYVVIKMVGGNSPIDFRNPKGEEIRILLLIGVKNSSRKGTAFEDVLGIMQRIKERFQKNRAVKHFSLSDPIEWAISEEDQWPYAFGGMDTKWIGTTMATEDPLI